MMYTITRGPSKLVTQRRTGPTQQIETKLNDVKFKPMSPLPKSTPPPIYIPNFVPLHLSHFNQLNQGDDHHDSPHPKIVFSRLNGKRFHNTATQNSASPASGFTPAHEENVRFVYEAWQEVEQKLGDGEERESTNSLGPIQYSEKNPSTSMKSFVPIDLEEWWAQRFLANIANLS